MDVHVRDLRYFVAVAEEMHFTRAAERLYVSQPALSKQVRALERQVGVPLLRRGGRGVTLTAAGEALLPRARRLLAEWQDAERELELIKARESASLVVGMSTSLGRGGLWPTVRRRFSRDFPAASIVLRQVGWRDPTAGLADRSTDVAFVWLPMPEPDRYRFLVVAREPRLVALPVGHRLAGQDRVAFADLAGEPFLALPESAGVLRDYWLALDARGGRPARIGAEVGGPEETYEALIDHRGVVLLAAGNAPLVVREGVVARPVTGIGPSEFALAWRRADHRPLVAGFVAACRAVAAAAPGPGPAPGPEPAAAVSPVPAAGRPPG